MSDEDSPAWTALKASLTPAFPQLLELEPGGRIDDGSWLRWMDAGTHA